jgi:site-specific recombinase XerD
MDKYWELTKKLPNKENQEVINEYLLSMKLGNRSPRTVVSSRRFLEHFFSDWSENFFDLSSDTIHKWFMEHQGHLSPVTFKNRLSILSTFYSFCVQEEYLERSPIKRRWFPRRPKSVPKYLEKKEIARVRRESEQAPLRNQAIVEFMLTSGCRVGEVHLLNIGDVDLENRTARVVGKGKKIRDVHFSEKCAILLERYLENRPSAPSAPLFTSLRKEKGRRLGISGLQSALQKIGKSAGLSSSLHPHRLRHTFATELLSKGAELSFISDELGHADLGTTQIYARLPNPVIISQYRKFMG